MPRRRPTQERSRRKFDALLAASRKLLVEVGFESFTCEEVAARAEVPIGTLYQFFANKYVIVCELNRQDLVAVSQEMAEFNGEVPSLDWLRHMNPSSTTWPACGRPTRRGARCGWPCSRRRPRGRPAPSTRRSSRRRSSTDAAPLTPADAARAAHDDGRGARARRVLDAQLLGAGRPEPRGRGRRTQAPDGRVPAGRGEGIAAPPSRYAHCAPFRLHGATPKVVSPGRLRQGRPTGLDDGELRHAMSPYDMCGGDVASGSRQVRCFGRNSAARRELDTRPSPRIRHHLDQRGRVVRRTGGRAKRDDAQALITASFAAHRAA